MRKLLGRWILCSVVAVLAGIFACFFLKKLTVHEDCVIPYITDGTVDWSSVKQVEIYADGCVMPPTTVISEEKAVTELVQAVCAASEYEKVPEEQYLEGMMGRWVKFDNGVVVGLYESENYGYIGTKLDAIGKGPFYRFPEKFYKMASSLGVSIMSLFSEKKEPEWEYISHVMMPDWAQGRIGAVLFQDKGKGTTNVAFFDEDGSFQQCGISAKLAEQPDFQYLGNGTVAFQVENEDGQICTYRLTISVDGNEVKFKAEEEPAWYQDLPTASTAEELFGTHRFFTEGDFVKLSEEIRLEKLISSVSYVSIPCNGRSEFVDIIAKINDDLYVNVTSVVDWSSRDGEIAYADNGRITAKAQGTTVITASLAGVQTDIPVSVEAEIDLEKEIERLSQ